MARPNPRTLELPADFSLILNDYYRDKAELGENTPQWILDKIDSMEAQHKETTGSYYKKTPDPIVPAPEYVKPEKPPRVSVFVEPPPETVTVAPPGYVKPEKPPRVSVFDPSTVSSFTPFGDLTLSQLVMDYYPLPEAVAEQEITLPSIYGGQYVPGVEPVPFTPMVVEYATSERDPIPITTDQVEPPIEPEPEVTTVDIEPPIEPELEVTTVDIEPPIEPEVITDDLEEAPTEERPVKWIPEPFFSFINEVFKR